MQFSWLLPFLFFSCALFELSEFRKTNVSKTSTFLSLICRAARDTFKPFKMFHRSALTFIIFRLMANFECWNKCVCSKSHHLAVLKWQTCHVLLVCSCRSRCSDWVWARQSAARCSSQWRSRRCRSLAGLRGGRVLSECRGEISSWSFNTKQWSEDGAAEKRYGHSRVYFHLAETLTGITTSCSFSIPTAQVPALSPSSVASVFADV